MRFVVVGAGAIGGAVGGRLFEQGYDVTLVARGDHGRALRSGLVLEAPDGTATLPVPVVDGSGAGAVGQPTPTGIPSCCSRSRGSTPTTR